MKYHASFTSSKKIKLVCESTLHRVIVLLKHYAGDGVRTKKPLQVLELGLYAEEEVKEALHVKLPVS